MSEAISSALGGGAERSNAPPGPDGASVCVWRRPIRELHLAPMRGYTLALHTGGSPVVRFWTGQRWSETESRPGMLTLIPPGLPTSWLVDGAMDAITVSVPVPRVESTAEEVLDRRSAELTFEFAFRDPLASTLASSLAQELIEPRADSALWVERLHDLLTLQLVRRSHRAAWLGRRRPGALSPRAFARATELMEARLETGVSLDELSRAAGLSRFHFARAFKRAAGVAPHEYLTRRRIERARELLSSTDLSIAEIALRVGFSSQSHFTSVFGRIAGAPPGRYRRHLR